MSVLDPKRRAWEARDGWFEDEQGDLQAVLTDVMARRRAVVSAAAVLTISERQTFRLLAQYQEQGSNGLTSEDRLWCK